MNVVELWHQAEAAIGDAEAFEAAVEVLPLRLEWLARALWALDAGDREAVSELIPRLREAGEHDVAAVLAAVVEPGTAPDDEAQALARLPLADLLSLFEAARATGAEVEPSEALVRTARGRIVLGGMLQMLVGGTERVARNPRLAHLMPRAEQIRVAGQLLELHGTVNNGTLGQAFEELLVDFSPERWPDLAVHPGLLLEWASGDSAWTRRHTHALRPAQRAPEDARRTLLGALLGRIQRDAQADRLLELAAPVWAAGELAASLDGLEDLVTQLRQLELRLRWVAEGEAPGELLESLWVHAQVSRGERIELARALIENPPDDPDPRVIVESQLYLLAHLPDAGEVASILEAGARGAPREMLEGGLEQMGASPGRARYVLGLHATHQGRFAEALDAVPAIVAEGDTAAAEALLEHAASRLVERHDTSAPLDEMMRHRLEKAAVALGQAERLSLDLAPLVLAAVRSLLGAVPEGLHGAVRRTLEGLGDSARERGAQIVALHLIADADGARDALREVGRTLREVQPASAATERALEIVAWILFWADPREREALETLIRPLSRFVLKDGAPQAAAAAVRVAEQGVSVLRGLVQWFLFEREALGDDGRWIELACRLVRVPDALEVYGTLLVKHVLESRPATVEALDEGMRGELESLIASGQSPEEYFASRRTAEPRSES